MRSKLLVCAALAGTCLLGAWSPAARAADPKGKAAKGKAKTGDGLTDDKVISKQMQWEDSVMGPDDKKAELEKIARAQAINKAAAEKAAREKEKADAQAAKEAAAPKPQTAKRGGDVAIPSVPDEPPAKKEIVEAPPPKPVKHGDDKFIDGLLKDNGGSKKRQSVDDKALNDLLAVEKPGAKPKRKDDVDSLLQSADKAPPMPETHAKKELQEWEKPEIQSTPQPTPVVLRQQPKRNDGVIRVVQGAATGPARTVPAPAPSRGSAVAARGAASHQASDGNWSDPFTGGQKKAVAARDSRHSSDFDDDLGPPRRRPAAPAARGSASDFDDPVKAAPKPAPAPRRAAPAAKPQKKWNDPFTQDVTPATKKAPAHTAVAARTPKAPAASGWDAARPRVAASESSAHAGGWGALKKHAR
jgi:hypothetical protein